MSKAATRKTTVCWLSSARYSQPLDAANARKWQLLAELNYDISVIGFATGWRGRRFREHVGFILLPQAPFSPLRYMTFFAMTPPLLAWLLLRGRADIIVAQSPFEGAVGAWVKLLGRLFGRSPKLIVENHNNFEVDVFLQRRVPLAGLFRGLMLAAARFAFRQADALRVISTSTAERARFFAPTTPQARFMTFSDTSVFDETRRTLPVNDAVDIVYAGVLIPRKGLSRLIDAFARLDHPRARLRLVGKAENAAYAAELRSQVDALGIGQEVDFVGAVSQRELARHFASARVMVLPSLSEGLGRVIVEAMLTGMPVIGARVGGIPDLIREGETGLLIAPDDADDLLRALRAIYAIDVAPMASAARAFAQDFFSPQKYADGYRRLFELALPPSVPPSGRGDESGAPVDNRPNIPNPS